MGDVIVGHTESAERLSHFADKFLFIVVARMEHILKRFEIVEIPLVSRIGFNGYRDTPHQHPAAFREVNAHLHGPVDAAAGYAMYGYFDARARKHFQPE